MKIPDNQTIADLVFKLYQNWAMDINFIYSYRTWVLNYSNKSKDGQALVVVNKMVDYAKAGLEQFVGGFEKLEVKDLLVKFNKGSKQNQPISQYLGNLSILINNL